MATRAPETDLAFLLSQASHALATELTARLAELGITPRAHCVLSNALGGELTQSQVAERCALDKTTMVVTLDALERDGRVLFRYVREDGSPAGPDDPANPNGSLRAIAGVMNERGNVAGLMPHPERAAEAILGSDDGLGIIRSIVDSAARAASGPVAVEAGSR